MKKIFYSAIKLFLALIISSSVSLAQNRQTEGVLGKQSIELKTLAGDAFSLDQSKGKVTVLAVGATWLPLSREQAAIINQLQQKYLQSPVAIYFVSTDSADSKSKNFADAAQIKSFVERNKLTVNILRDTNGSALKNFKVDQIPAFVILDKNGEVAATIVGLDIEDNNFAINQIADRINKVL